MSNLNDFIGKNSLNFWKHSGISNISTHGLYDGPDVAYGPVVQILGTTSVTHHYGEEFKLHHVPDKRVFAGYEGAGQFQVKINLGADKTNAPDPSANVYAEVNLVPTLTAVIRCLSYKIYTKQAENDAYVLKDTITFESKVYTDYNYNKSLYVPSSNADVHTQVIAHPHYSGQSNQSHWWQGAWVTKNNFGNIAIYRAHDANINESFLDTDNEGPVFIKVQWELDNTAWNNLFSRSYNEVEGIMFDDMEDTVMGSLYAGQRSYNNGFADGNQYSG